eukprot:765986-Hanusia_phi.AAC.4
MVLEGKGSSIMIYRKVRLHGMMSKTIFSDEKSSMQSSVMMFHYQGNGHPVFAIASAIAGLHFFDSQALLERLMLLLSRLCIVTTIPVVNGLSQGQAYTVVDGHEGITQEPLCGIVVPLLALLRNKFHQPPHNIQNSTFCPEIVEDVLCSVLCWWCTLQQIQRHMQSVNAGYKGPVYLFAPDTTNTMNDAKDS